MTEPKIHKDGHKLQKYRRRRKGNRGGLWHKLYRDRALYLIVAPFVIYFVLFVLRPMWGVRIAFYDYNIFKGIEGSRFVGLEHFISFIRGPYFGRLLKNTVMINLYGLVFGFPAPILLAVLLNEMRHQKYKKIIQTITYMPHFISTVVVVGIVTNLLAPGNGLVNQLIRMAGVENIYFLMEAKYFRPIYTIMCIWQEAGFNAIIYMAAMAAIDPALYEACVMDGGGRFRQFLHVTLPGILPTVVVMFIMRIGNILNVGYEAIILLYQPSTYEVADVISTYVYRAGIANGNYALGSAVGLFNSLVGIILVWISNRISRRFAGTGLW